MNLDCELDQGLLEWDEQGRLRRGVHLVINEQSGLEMGGRETLSSGQDRTGQVNLGQVNSGH